MYVEEYSTYQMSRDNPIIDSSAPLLKTSGLQKYFVEGGEKRVIFDGINFECQQAQSISIIGPSGSGKSTFLHLLGLLDLPTSGSITLEGEDSSTWSDKKKAAYRASSIGFVFQKHLLISELSLIENIALPLLRSGETKKIAIQKAENLMEQMGLSHRKNAQPNHLSGGELQRGSICRALIHNPKILLMDEPTGSLDTERGNAVISEILSIVKPSNTACIIVTHNLEFTKQTDLAYKLSNTNLHEC
jgi:ABC-type lipoprotein export system ATPase subunit